ncbi:MAG: AAA family ATPase [Burkholderiales bacterium]|nr:AAA family ATPase [Burkholderiales bacterium]
MTTTTDIRCPDALRDLPGWLVWRYERIPNREKPLKVPYYVGGGRRHGDQGTDADRKRLSTFDKAHAFAIERGFDGVGFATLADFNIVAVDYDNCVQGGRVHATVLEQIAGTHAELSPSGTGVRAFFVGNLGNRKDTSQDEHGFGLEVFSTAGYVTLTGNVLPECEFDCTDGYVAPVTPTFRAAFDQRFARRASEAATTSPMGLSDANVRKALAAIDSACSYDTWLQVGMALHHETQGNGFELWDDWSSTAGSYPGRDELEHKWSSFSRSTGQVVTARSLVHVANENGADIDVYDTALDQLDVLPDDAPASPKANPNCFPILTAADFMDGTPLDYWIKGLLPKADLAMIYGDSAAGKTFFTLDIAAHVAMGLEWRGKRTKQGKILYVVAEGQHGFRQRLKAFCQHNDIDPKDFPVAILAVAPNLLEKNEAINLSAAIQAAGSFDIVILDTWAQVTPGAKENTSEDMGKALRHCRLVTNKTGAMVVMVHHANKEGTVRGHTSVKAACDAVIEVSRGPKGRLARLEKSKDGVDGTAYPFELEIVTLGYDEDDEPITSCVVRASEGGDGEDSLEQLADTRAQSAEGFKVRGSRQRAIVHACEEYSFEHPEATTLSEDEIVSRAAKYADTEPKNIRASLVEMREKRIALFCWEGTTATMWPGCSGGKNG